MTRAVVKPLSGDSRKRLLDTLVRDRICECGEGPLRASKQWVVLMVLDTKESIAMCRSCFGVRWRRGEEEGVYVRKTPTKPLGPWFREVRGYVLEPVNLTIARESMGLSQARFAKLLGWSRMRYRAAEQEVTQVSEHDVKKIREVLGDD